MRNTLEQTKVLTTTINYAKPRSQNSKAKQIETHFFLKSVGKKKTDLNHKIEKQTKAKR